MITKMSVNSILLTCIFILFCFFYRVLIPFGDEPDFTVRAPALLQNSFNLLSPYNLYHIFSEFISVNSIECRPSSAPLDIWAYVPPSCFEEHNQVFIRTLVSILVTLPLFLFCIFTGLSRKLYIMLVSEITNSDFLKITKSLSLAILLPSMIYYLGVFADEQFFLVCAMMLFVFYRSFFLVIIILTSLSFIDFGNSIVCSFFIVLLFVSEVLIKKSRKLCFIFMLLLVIFSLIVGYTLLEYIAKLDFLTGALHQKSQAIFDSLDGSVFVDKYPVILRPVVTFMTFTFMTPSGLKVLPLYIIFGIIFVIVTLKVYKQNNPTLDLYWFVPLATMLFFVFLFPTYGNAKYFVFVTPFLMYVITYFFCYKRIVISLVCANFLVLGNLLLFRINF